MTEHAQDISERDAVLRERAAHAKAICWAMHSHAGLRVPWEVYDACKRCEADAKYKYPLVIQHPRVVKDKVTGINETVTTWEWRAVDGHLQCRLVAKPGGPYDGYEFGWRVPVELLRSVYSLHTLIPTPARVKMWADLLENPLESVSDPLDLPGAP